MREFKNQLAGIVDRLQESGSEPVFVGSHRKPEVVVMAVHAYEQMQELTERQRAMANAIASGRLEGREPSPRGMEILTAVADGRMSDDDALKALLALHQKSGD